MCDEPIPKCLHRKEVKIGGDTIPLNKRIVQGFNYHDFDLDL